MIQILAPATVMFGFVGFLSNLNWKSELLSEGTLYYLLQVNKLKKHLYSEEMVELPQTLKQKIADEILKTLKGLNGERNVTIQQGKCHSDLILHQAIKWIIN